MSRAERRTAPAKLHRRDLLANARVRTWHEARSLKSRLSADVDLRKLGLLLERIGHDPESIVLAATKDSDHLQETLIQYAAALKRSGRVDDYVAKTLSGLKSYLRFRRVHFDGFPVLSPIRGSTLTNERVPTPEELGRVLNRLSLRGRTSALFVAHAGVRFQVLGDYTGEHGLTLGDLPDLELGPEPRFKDLPFVVRVPAELSKTRVSYITFGTGQLASDFLSYLADRRTRGEELGASSPVIAPTSVERLRGATLQSRSVVSQGRRFIVTGALVRELARALQATTPKGVRWRPYVLRCYCSTRLMMAEGAGKITRDLREAILGHDTGVSGRYNVGKTWGPDLLKEARMAYKRAEPYLLTSAKVEEGNENATRVIRLLLEARGVSKEVLDKHDLGSMSDEEIVALIKTVGASPGTEKKTQRAVPVEDVPKLLEEGWEYIAPLNGSMAVVKAPL